MNVFNKYYYDNAMKVARVEYEKFSSEQKKAIDDHIQELMHTFNMNSNEELRAFASGLFQAVTLIQLNGQDPDDIFSFAGFIWMKIEGL